MYQLRVLYVFALLLQYHNSNSKLQNPRQQIFIPPSGNPKNTIREIREQMLHVVAGSAWKVRVICIFSFCLRWIRTASDNDVEAGIKILCSCLAYEKFNSTLSQCNEEIARRLFTFERMKKDPERRLYQFFDGASGMLFGLRGIWWVQRI